MPNPLNNRRRLPSANAEIEALKKELSDLKAMYVQDMAAISSDMQQLGAQTQNTATPPA